MTLKKFFFFLIDKTLPGNFFFLKSGSTKLIPNIFKIKICARIQDKFLKEKDFCNCEKMKRIAPLGIPVIPLDIAGIIVMLSRRKVEFVY